MPLYGTENNEVHDKPDIGYINYTLSWPGLNPQM